jgi:hypothetical protein
MQGAPQVLRSPSRPKEASCAAFSGRIIAEKVTFVKGTCREGYCVEVNLCVRGRVWKGSWVDGH